MSIHAPLTRRIGVWNSRLEVIATSYFELGTTDIHVVSQPLGFDGLVCTVTLPAVTASATVISSNATSADVTLPSLQVTGYFGAHAAPTLPALTVASAVTVPAITRCTITLPTLSVESSVSAGTICHVDAHLPPLSVLSYGGCVAELTLPALGAVAAGVAGTVSSVAVDLPTLLVTSTVTENTVARVDVTLPALAALPANNTWITLPALTVEAEAGVVVAVTREAYAINLSNGAVTRYTDYPFDNVLRLGNDFFGIAPTGVFKIGGSLDIAAPINAHAKTFSTSFGSANYKRVPYTYLSGRADNGVVVGVQADEGDTYEYDSSFGENELLNNHRSVVGKGIRGVYYSFSIANVSGGKLEVDELAVQVAATQRAI